ncbi:MAG: hypothetical protein AAFR60_08155 [Pseudomonadota bacterium]
MADAATALFHEMGEGEANNTLARPFFWILALSPSSQPIMFPNLLSCRRSKSKKAIRRRLSGATTTGNDLGISP